MKKYFVISDIHSFFTPFKKALDDAGFDPTNKDHWLIVAGDLFDRGPDSLQVYNYISKLKRKILIRGNHEDLFEDAYKRQAFLYYDLSNGTVKTFYEINKIKYNQFLAFNSDNDTSIFNTNKTRLLREWINQKFVDYVEFTNFVIVHSWIPLEVNENCEYCYNPKWRKASQEEWQRARWGNPFKWSALNLGVPNKKIIVGHWHCSAGWANILNLTEFGRDARFDIFENDNLIAIDACTAHSNKCNVFVFEDDAKPKKGKTYNQWTLLRKSSKRKQ